MKFIELILLKSEEPDIVLDAFSTVYIKTDNEAFIEEIQKFTCYARALNFLEDNQGGIYEELVETPKKIDISIDLSQSVEDVINDLTVPMSIKLDVDSYITHTPHLGVYGTSA